MQRSSVLILLCALTVAGAVALAIQGGGSAPEPPPAGPSGSRSPPPDPHQAIHGDEPSVPRPDVLRVHVEVRSEVPFVAPPPPRVRVRLGSSDTWLPAAVVAGEGAGFDPPRARPGAALVAIAQDGGHQLLRQVALGDDGEVEYRIGAPVVVRGHVLGDQQWPLRDAEVWLGELDAEGHRVTATTDAEGAFELYTPDGDGVPLVVSAPKRATHWRTLTVPRSGVELDLALQPGVQLDVQLAAAADDIVQARVFLVPQGAVSTGLSQYPFFVQALSDGYAVDGNGHATVTDLPAEGSLGVLVRHPRLLGTAAHPVVLRGAAARTVVPLRFAAGVATARVVDVDGAPLAGVLVWSRATGQELAASTSARLLPPQLPLRGACATATDAEGRFTVGRVEGADAVLSLRADGFAGIDVPLAQVGAAPIVLPAWRGGECAFRLAPPAAGVAWAADCNLGGGVQTALEADQPWTVSFPHPGRFTVVVTTQRGDTVLGSATSAGLDVTGTVELQAPRAD